MRKKDYQKPTMTIVEVGKSQMLMTSVISVTRDGYGIAETEIWDVSVEI